VPLAIVRAEHPGLRGCVQALKNGGARQSKGRRGNTVLIATAVLFSALVLHNFVQLPTIYSININ